MVGVLRSPRAVFRSLIARPRWAGVMLTTYLVTAASGVALMETTVGRQALVDQWERTALAFGREVGDDQYRQLVAWSEHGGAYWALRAAVTGPVLTLALAAVLRAVFNAASRAHAAYRQVLAVVAHAGVILALWHLVAAPAAAVTETLASPTAVGRFVPLFDETSPMARLLGGIDLFVLWWATVLAIGVAVLYRRPARGIIIGFLGACVGFAALLAIVMALTGGTL